MDNMQMFYESYMTGEDITPYLQLSEVTLEDIPLDDLLDWEPW